MEVVNIGFERTAICPITIATTIEFLMMEVLECLQVTEEANLGLKIPGTLPIIIVEFIVMVIEVVTMEEVDIGLKIPDTLPLAILDKLLVATG